MEENLKKVGNFELLGKDSSNSYNIAKHLTTKKLYAYRKLSAEENRKNIEEKIVEKTSDNLVSFIKEEDLIFWELCNGKNLYSFIKLAHFDNSLNESHIQQIIRKIINGLEDLSKNEKILGGISLNNLFFGMKRKERDDERYNQKLNNEFYEKFIEGENSISYNIKIKYFISSYERKEVMKCKKADRLTANNIDYLTKYYMAPEILKDPDNNINPTAAYIWSLGIIAYQLLTQLKIPFEDDNDENIDTIIKNIEKGEISIPDNICPSLSIIKFITSLLKIKPSDRPSLKKVKNHEFLKSKPENFDFINIKLLCQDNKNLILNINEDEPINKYLINTGLESKIKKGKLTESKMLNLDEQITNLKNILDQLKEEYKHLNKGHRNKKEMEDLQRDINITEKELEIKIKEKKDLDVNKASIIKFC